MKFAFFEIGIFFILFKINIFSHPGHHETREWTNKKGQKISAVLTDVKEDIFYLKKSNGRIYKLSKNSLVDEDISWGEEWEEEESKLKLKKNEEFKKSLNNDDDIDSDSDKNKKWPTRSKFEGDVNIEIVSEDRERRKFIYRSDNFEFFVDTRLSLSVLREFSRLFEGTYLALVSLPLRLKIKKPSEDYFYKVKLYSSLHKYISEGGPNNSAGYYSRRTKVIYIPLISLGVKKKGKRYIKNRNKDNGTLVHEIVHQVNHKWLGVIPVWLSEGLADYIESTHRRQDRFDFINIGMKVRREINIYNNPSKSYVMRNLKELLNLSYAEWSTDLSSSLIKGKKNYNSALILATYFFHYEKDGVNTINKFMIDLSKGMKKKEATEKYLLKGLSIKEFSEKFRTEWRSSGNLKISFL